MKNIIKLLSLVFLLSLTTVACSDKKACDAECKKECCEKKDTKSCKPGCEKECCAKKDAKTCEPGCEKECCAAKADSTEVNGDEQVHVCTPTCEADPHSCPNHSHDDHAGHDH